MWTTDWCGCSVWKTVFDLFRERISVPVSVFRPAYSVDSVSERGWIMTGGSCSGDAMKVLSPTRSRSHHCLPMKPVSPTGVQKSDQAQQIVPNSVSPNFDFSCNSVVELLWSCFEIIFRTFWTCGIHTTRVTFRVAMLIRYSDKSFFCVAYINK